MSACVQGVCLWSAALDLRCDDDVVAILTNHAILFAANPHHNLSQCTYSPTPKYDTAPRPHTHSFRVPHSFRVAIHARKQHERHASLAVERTLEARAGTVVHVDSTLPAH